MDYLANNIKYLRKKRGIKQKTFMYVFGQYKVGKVGFQRQPWPVLSFWKRNCR